MLVPAAMEKLGETDSALGHAAGEQAVVCESPGDAGVFPIERENGFRFVGKIRQLWRGGLHAKCHLILADAGKDFRIAHFAVAEVVQASEVVEHFSAVVSGDTFGIVEEKDGVFPAAELHALMAGGEESAAPEAGKDWLAGILPGTLRGEDDVGRQVAVHAAKAVRNPRTHARKAGKLRTCVDESNAGIVVDRLRVHGADDGHVVGDFGSIREVIAHPLAALTVLGKFPEALADWQVFLPGGHAGEALALADGIREILAVDSFQFRLVIEKVNVGWPAGLEKVYDPLRGGGEMRVGWWGGSGGWKF